VIRNKQKKESTNMTKHILLGLGIAGACVAALNGIAGAASCTFAQTQFTALCRDANNWTGTASHSGKNLFISLSGGNAVTHPARASTIARNGVGQNIGSDQILTSVQNPNPSHTKTLAQSIATQDVFVTSN
jgi:hypothetical protein